MKKLMKKLLPVIGLALGIVLTPFLMVQALTCTNVFPGALNNYTTGQCIPSAWANALENAIGITGSSNTSTLTGAVNYLFTNTVATGTVANLSSTVTALSSTVSTNATQLNNLSSTVTAINYPSSTWFKVANNLSEGNAGTMRTNLGLGSIATFASTDYLQSSTAYVSKLNGFTGIANITAGNNVTITTSTSGGSSTIQVAVSTSASAAGTDQQIQYNNAGIFGATSTFTFTSSTQLFSLGDFKSSEQIGSQSQFISSLATTTAKVSYTFNYSGSIQTFTLPTNITGNVSITAYGASGGWDTSNQTLGTYGGSMAGTLSSASSTGGTIYYLCIGGQGQNTNLGNTSNVPGGFCGGGNATSGASRTGAGGGGMSWIGASSTFSTSTVVIVAGGAGGAGNNNGGADGVGGTGGGATGGSGGNAGGGGGSQTGGGALSGNGGNGSAGQGGFGGTAGGNGGGGGGGGGFYGGGGGGGGASGGGGGGGSSYAQSSLTATSTVSAVNNGNGYIILSFSVIGSPFGLAVNGHILTGGPAPTSPNGVITGNDTAGIDTVASSTTSYILTFGQPTSNPRKCTGDMSTGTAAYFTSIYVTTTTATFTTNTGLSIGSVFQYECLDI